MLVIEGVGGGRGKSPSGPFIIPESEAIGGGGGGGGGKLSRVRDCWRERFGVPTSGVPPAELLDDEGLLGGAGGGCDGRLAIVVPECIRRVGVP